MNTYIAKSYAKINIALNIVRKREDGYHELDMVMLPLKLHDSLRIDELKAKKDNFVIMDDYTNFAFGHNNIASNAIDIFNAKTGLKKRFKILIHKNIPMQAGMGGGSSNAAATILALNHCLNTKLSNETMMEMCKPLGSDVSFFILNKPARCRGRGEIIEPINVKNNYYSLIVKPEGGCSTKDVYKRFAENPQYNTCDVDKVIEALENGDDDLLAESISNSLTEPAIKVVPEIKTIIDLLKSEGLKIVMMTGSGSAVFALSTDKKALKKVLKKYENKYRMELTEVLK